MRAIVGIAWLGLRTAVSSRLLLTLGLLTAAAAVGMPLLVTGDGSPDGAFRVMQTYALGTVWLLLCVTTLWAAGAFISGEIEDRSLRMVRVRPIRAWQIWLGKWLAILLVNAGLLAVAGTAVHVIVFRQLHKHPELQGADGTRARRDLRMAWLALPPDITPPDRAIARLLNQWGERGLLPEDAEGLRRAERAARRDVLARRSTAAPGEALSWAFPPTPERSRLLRQHPPLRLRFTYTTSPFDRQFVSGTWRLTAGDAPPVEIETPALYDGRHMIELPGELREWLRMHDAALHVTFENADAERSIAVMFHAHRPVELLAPAGAYATALLRILLVMLGVMATLAAIGLTAGALFSSPVALFVSAGLLTAFAVANSPIALDLEVVAPPTGTLRAVLHRGGGTLLQGVRGLSAPAFRIAPLQAIADGTAPTWADTGQSLAILMLAYPALLMIAGGSILGRRQLAT